MNQYVERYLYAAGKYIPKSRREEKLRELEAVILEKLGGNTSPSDEEVFKVLKEMGRPFNAVREHMGFYSHVIGPAMIELYVLLVCITVCGVAIGLTVSFFIDIIGTDLLFTDLLLRFGKLIASFIFSALTAIGFITVFFALFEYVADPKDIEFKRSPFDPAKLIHVKQKSNGFKLSESIFALVFTVIAIILFNLVFINGIVFNPIALNEYLPLWNISWTASILLHVLLIVKREWTYGLYIFDILADGFSIYILSVMIRGPYLLLIEEVPVIGPLDQLLRIVFGIAIFGTCIGIITKLVKMIKKAIAN